LSATAAPSSPIGVADLVEIVEVLAVEQGDPAVSGGRSMRHRESGEPDHKKCDGTC
jgi:hypothetical protein